MNLSLVVLTTLFCLALSWPPSPPTNPRDGIDIPGADFPGMPVTLSSANPTLCANMCEQKVGCRAWAYAIPGCDSFKEPMCWLKFVNPHNDGPNKCRISGFSSKPCQMTTQWTSQVNVNNPLPEYPRPQLTRGPQSWKNLNGLWEFQPATPGEAPPFGKTLSSQVLVPFPVESCLSGIGWNYQYLWYRLVFDEPPGSLPGHLLNFGAVDWQTTVYLNRQNIGSHTGGYDPFTFDVSNILKPSGNELIVYVYDPSDHGRQPFGKQRISAMVGPGGDTYTPSSGIWQTVWLENVPRAYINNLKIFASMTDVSINVDATSAGLPVSFVVKDGNNVVASATGRSGTPVKITVPNPKLWEPTSPFLYNLVVTLGTGSTNDTVGSYFGMRTVRLGKDSTGTTRPMINNKFTFLAGWLDQSWWPDGQYTAPTDEALAFDLKAVQRFGYNFVRLHQKVNSQRWYYYADTLGIVIQQDMVQHYGDAFATPDPNYYMSDLKAMIDNLYNHPSIFQWTAFNEGDMVSHFNASYVVDWIKNYDPSRLVDTDSGGPANDLHVGDVNDIHDYPNPQDPKPSNTQYAEIGEFGGLGTYITGHMWVEGECGAYEHNDTPEDLKNVYIGMTKSILSNKKDVSASVYTQITDVENECDGFYNMDRTDKFNPTQISQIAQANQALIRN